MTETPSILAAAVILRALASAGVRDVVYCPGSRSAPFAYALDALVAEGILRAHVRIDERSAAFLAVGLSRGSAFEDALPDESGRLLEDVRPPSPVVVITTSGGAVAELHAGIAEAHHSRLPIIAVTADRPFEMRGVGASQTTDQPGIFGPHVRGVWDVPAGIEADHRLASIVARAVAAAVGAPTGTPGPVQINVGFRDPLTPAGPAAPVAAEPAIPQVLRAAPTPVPWEAAVDAEPRTVIVAGDGADLGAADWAAASGLPILAEPTSGLTRLARAVPFEQTMLASSGLSAEIRQVIVVGRPTLSRPVSALLAREDLRVVIVAEGAEWADVAGRADLVVAALAAPTSRVLGVDEWFAEWAAEAERVAEALTGLDLGLGADDALTTLGAAAVVAAAGAGPLVLGASNSVRAVDLVAADGPVRPILSNRGLAGIDGTIATSIGVAVATGGPTVALMGDLAFFHDAGALAIPEGEPVPDLDLVIVDDHGGAIFAGLEHGRPEYAGVFDRWFAAAQPTSIENVALAHGCEYHEAHNAPELEGLLSARQEGTACGIRILHVRVGVRPDLFAAVSRAALRR